MAARERLLTQILDDGTQKDEGSGFADPALMFK